MHLQTKKRGATAKSTTSQEFEDNLWLIVNEFHGKTKQWPLLSYDNNKIQVGVNISNLTYAQGHEDKEVFRLIPEQHKVDLPTYSPDMNRPIEHVFAQVKGYVRDAIYKGESDFSNHKELHKVVLEAFKALKPAAIRDDIKGLPLLWRILNTTEGETFEYPPNHKHVGTGGGYAPARYC